MTEQQEWQTRADALGITVEAAKQLADDIANGRVALTQGPATIAQRRNFIGHCLQTAEYVAGRPVMLLDSGEIVKIETEPVPIDTPPIAVFEELDGDSLRFRVLQ